MSEVTGGVSPTERRAMKRWVALAMVAALGLATAACGGDDDESSVGADTSKGRACSAVGTELESVASHQVAVTLEDYQFAPAALSSGAGVVTFTATNRGSEDHELAFLPGGGEVPLTAEGAPDEDALEAQGAFELEAFGPDQSCKATYDLEPGTYTLFCIVEAIDGSTHLSKGMKATLTVA